MLRRAMAAESKLHVHVALPTCTGNVTELYKRSTATNNKVSTFNRFNNSCFSRDNYSLLLLLGTEFYLNPQPNRYLIPSGCSVSSNFSSSPSLKDFSSVFLNRPSPDSRNFSENAHTENPGSDTRILTMTSLLFVVVS